MREAISGTLTGDRLIEGDRLMEVKFTVNIKKEAISGTLTGDRLIEGDRLIQGLTIYSACTQP